MKSNELASLRESIALGYAELAGAHRRNWLLERIDAKCKTPLQQAERVFCIHHYLIDRHYKDVNEAKRFLKQALAFLEEEASDNRLSKRFLRDMQNTAGVFYARHKDDQSALAMYREAIKNDADTRRVGIVKLNMARLHLARGELYLALTNAKSIRDASVDTLIAQASQLLKVRIMLLLGMAGKASQILGQIKGRIENKTLRRERSYLKLIAQFPFEPDDRYFEKWSAFIETLKTSDQPWTAYALEREIYRRLYYPQEYKNRKSVKQKLQYLSSGTDDKTLYDLAVALDAQLTKPREKDCTRELEAMLRQAALQSHDLTALYTAVVTAEVVAEKHGFEGAAILSKFLTDQWRRKESGFSAHTIRELQTAGSPLRARSEQLIEDLQKYVEEPADDWLLH